MVIASLAAFPPAIVAYGDYPEHGDDDGGQRQQGNPGFGEKTEGADDPPQDYGRNLGDDDRHRQRDAAGRVFAIQPILGDPNRYDSNNYQYQ